MNAINKESLFVSLRKGDFTMLSLNGKWKFHTSDEKAKTFKEINFEDRIDIPSCVEEFFENHKKYMLFKKNLVMDFDPQKRYLLNFDAVDYHADVFINGEFLGSHDGGYTPFSFEITNKLKRENEIVVQVYDLDEARATEVLHGKQNGIPNWYGNVSGIWRDVYITEKAQNFFEDIYVDASYLRRSMKIHGSLENKTNSKIKVLLKDEDKILIEKLNFIDSKDFTFEFSVDEIRPWSFDDPKLYSLELELIEENKIIDRWESKIGFRDIESVNEKILLNGKEIFVRGALDQDFYPFSLYTTPSTAYLRDEFLKAKQMGLNLLRCHIKVPDKRYLDLADEIGILIWEEVPNFDKFTEQSTKEFEKTLSEIVKRDYNHPAFVIFTIINESWGVDLSKEAHRNWMFKMYKKAKEIIGNRLVVDNSACCNNFHIESDINDFHFYKSLDHFNDWNSDIARFSSGTFKTFSSYGDSKESGKEPKVISEFGIWGLPAFIRDIKNMDKPFRDIKETIPDGVEDRFLNSSLSKHFKNYEEFAILTQKEQFNALKYQIEEMRLHEQIKGYVITEFTDVFWEANGLLDMHRRPKLTFEFLKWINSDLAIIPRAERYNFYKDEDIDLEVTISNYSGMSGKFDLEIGLDDKMTKEIDLTGNLTHVKESLKVKKSGLKKIWFKLKKGNKVLAQNYMEIGIFERVSKIKHEGKIVNIESPGKYNFGNTTVEVLKKKDFLDGNWISNFNWMDPTIFGEISDGGIVDMRHLPLLRNDLLMNVSGPGEILFGTTYGWIYGDFAYLAKIHNGSDDIFVTTLAFSEADPMSNVLRNNLS
ncbi:MAG: glycoside hydrolase family 2 TIM barrel-domain containing protein [Candidatus Parvarchaeota archaeon]